MTGLTLEGAVFNKEFQLEDHAEKMIQTDGFLLKLSFYSKESVTARKG